MAESNRKIIGKMQLEGILECVTGLHIGASKENMEIGALDSPVVRDPITLEPYIPGSSLKGKLRSLLEKATPTVTPNRNGGTPKNPIMRHECDDSKQANNCPVCRLFGSTGPGEGNKNFPARIKIRDLALANADELKKMDTGLLYTEWKFENSIDRVTSAANPRNLERVPRGAKFKLSIVYDVEDIATLEQDLENLRLAIRLLHDDSLGGHGSRGYGQVKIEFTSIEARKLDHYKGVENNTKRIKELDHIDELVRFFETA